MQNQSKIICPKCGTEIDVQNVLSHQIEEEIKKSIYPIGIMGKPYFV